MRSMKKIVFFSTKNTLISLMVVVKDFKGSRHDVVKQKLSCILLSVIEVLAESRPVLIKNPKTGQV